VEGCGGAALERWEPQYLTDTAGDARLELLEGVYSASGRRARFAEARKRTLTLGAYVRALLDGAAGAGYLFNTESGVLLTSDQPELQVGWGRAPNPGLAPLARDLALPEFLRPESVVYAALILGGPAQTAPLHYDLGGEAKCLIQLRGRKRVLLFPPSSAGFLGFPSWFEEAPEAFRVPHATEVELDEPDLARFPELVHAGALEAELGPGDALYWPSFWAHHVRNRDAFTLAVSVTLEELRPTAMHMRENLGILSRMLLRLARERGLDVSSGPGLMTALQALERELFSEENRGKSTMWSWHNAIWHA
jgi:hypothetical protein